MKNSSTVKRVWVLLSGAGAGFYPLLSCALGLGDLQVESALNQPLRARIEIVGVLGDGENAPIHARFAPDVVPSDGTNTGLLQALKLSVEQDATHRYFVVVSSTEPLTEPLFDLPVQVSADSLQVVRNYSVLLDPPTLEDRPRSAPVLVAAPTPAVPVAQNGPAVQNKVAAQAKQIVPPAPAVSPAAAEPGVYTVARSDTLRRITRRLGARTQAERVRLA
jgi:pilus assembly protein FimV